MLFTSVIKDNRLFIRCYKSGRYCASPLVTAYYLPNGLPQNRVGISVSKKIGGAVERNRAKRIIRAAYRLGEKDFPIGYDVVFVARPAIGGAKSTDIERYLKKRLIDDIVKNADKFKNKKL